jgi:hypothetical protein
LSNDEEIPQEAGAEAVTVRSTISGKVDTSRLHIVDERGLGPLPANSVEFLAAMGATEVHVSVKDGRSWIVTGVNVFRGEKRVFMARVFHNGFVRGYLAPPLEHLDELLSDLREVAAKVMDGERAGGAGQGQ